MKNFITSLVFITFMMIGFPALAQEDAVSISNDNLSDLIKTLESESARSEFIGNLKTLQKAQSEKEQEEKADEAPAVVSDLLGIEGQFHRFIENYEVFLAENDLNSSVIGKALLTFISLVIFLILGLFVRRFGHSLRDKLLKLKDRFALSHDRFRFYARLVRYGGYVALVILFIYTLGLIWDVTDFSFLKNEMGVAIIGNFLSVFLVACVAVIIWEIINGFLEFGMRHAEGRSGNRLQTLLPILRNVVFIIFAVLFTLVMLSELGINIMPLLAGAGIFGIAVGFGAQTMVKDFLTGFTIIFEDLIQVGDVATLGGKTGWIEKITIRKVQLRNLDGTVYTVPFSEIDIVENMTKGYSYYLMDIGIAYRENPDEVIEYLKEIDEDLRSDEEYKGDILEPLEILGVDNFADSAVIIKARIKTLARRQWVVGREFNRRMKHKFDEKNVEIPFPHQTIYFGEDKKGNAPPAPILIKEAKPEKA